MIRKHRVLIVEDDPTAQERLRSLCEALGFEVEIAADVKKAQKLLRDRIYCLVLLDMRLPRDEEQKEPWKRAGMEILRSVRERFDWRRLPVIIMTAFGEDYLIVSAFKAGANDFAKKPFEDEEQEPLEKKIRDALLFGCESRRSCPHLEGESPAGKRVYTARYNLRLIGDRKQGRALAVFQEDEVWFQCNTFEGLFTLVNEDKKASDPDGWVHASLLFPGIKNTSHAVRKMVEDIEEVTGVTDLVERQPGRLRLCIPPDCVTWDLQALLREFKNLVKKYCA